MISKMLPIMERSLLNTIGVIPVVSKTFDRVLKAHTKYSVPYRQEVYELVYLKKGVLDVQIEDKKERLHARHAIFIKPFLFRSFEAVDETSEFICVHFSFSNQGYGEDDKRNVALVDFKDAVSFLEGNDLLNANPYVVFKDYGNDDLFHLMDLIHHENKEDQHEKPLMLQCMAIELFLMISRCLKKEWEVEQCVKSGKARELVKIARDFVIQNFSKNISVADVSRHVFLSQGYFARAFRDETGMSPMAFLIQIRVAKACEILESDDIRVGSIATRVGFSSPQRFNAAFKKHMGITPMNYRKKFLKSENASD